MRFVIITESAAGRLSSSLYGIFRPTTFGGGSSAACCAYARPSVRQALGGCSPFHIVTTARNVGRALPAGIAIAGLARRSRSASVARHSMGVDLVNPLHAGLVRIVASLPGLPPDC